MAVFACLLWSTAFAGVKFGLQFSRPLSFAGIRFILSGLILLPFCGNIRIFISTVKKNASMIFQVAFFQTFLVYTFFYLGITYVSGALAAIIIGSSPLINAITAHYTLPDDKMKFSRILKLAVGLVGIIIISINRKPWCLSGFKELTGIFILLIASFSSSIGNIVVAKKHGDINPVILNTVQIFCGGLMLLILSIPFEGFFDFNKPLRFYGVLFWLSTLSAVSFSIWFYLLKKPNIKVSELNVWKFIIPLFGAIISWIFIAGESPQPVSVIGMILVTTSIVLYNLSGRNKYSLSDKGVS